MSDLIIKADSLGYYICRANGSTLYGPYNVLPGRMKAILKRAIRRGVTSPTWEDYTSPKPKPLGGDHD